MRPLLNVAAAIGIAAMSAAAFGQQKSSELELIDYTDDFARIHDRDASLADAERVKRFKAEFARLLPGFYSHERAGAPVEKYDAFLLNAIKRFPERRAGIARVSAQFRGLLAPAQTSFEAEFGPMTGFPPVLLIHSLGEFDGGTRSLTGGTRLMFGADMIDEIYKTTPIQPFFHHELFHLLHHRTFDCELIWCSLWTEGLATYVAAQLNPGASDAALLLTWPEPLRPAVEARWSDAICYVRVRLTSQESKDFRALFSGGKLDEGTPLPSRFGDYVGYLVAQDLGQTRSLKQLASLSPEQARPLIEASLAKMDRCDELRRGERG